MGRRIAGRTSKPTVDRFNQRKTDQHFDDWTDERSLKDVQKCDLYLTTTTLRLQGARSGLEGFWTSPVSPWSENSLLRWPPGIPAERGRCSRCVQVLFHRRRSAPGGRRTTVDWSNGDAGTVGGHDRSTQRTTLDLRRLVEDYVSGEHPR